VVPMPRAGCQRQRVRGMSDPVNPLNDLRSFASEELKRHAESQAASRREGNHAKEPVGIQRTTTEMPALRGFTDPPQKARRQKNLPPPEGGKPFAFALGKADDGATIWWGMLAAKLQILNFTREDGFLTSVTQPPILKTDFYPVSGIDADTTKPTHLGFWDDVYVYWEADDSGTISIVEIRGPEAPDGEDIGELEPDLTREITSGKYFVKIGTVPENGDIDQQVSSDIPWFVTIAKGTDTSGSDSGGSEGSDGSSSGSLGSTSSVGPGSDKSTAIVPVSFYSTGFTALFTVESPDVRFEDVFADLKIRGRTTRYLIDERFIEVIHADTLRVVGICGDKPYAVGAVIEGRHLVVHALSDKRRRPDIIQVKFSAIRKGFKGMRFPTRTKAQFEANEKFLNSAYPRK